jgi:hypothetical protein
MVSSALAVVTKNTFERSNGKIEVIVPEGEVLGRIEDFQECGRRVAAVIAS